ncbi:2-oxoadipate dioxygenase/decarboxylase [Corynebacterium glutamicum]|nr:VOC family protein [Corynebacterium glutamicum]
MSFKKTWQLRAEFARRLSEMYGMEVPAYNTLVDVSERVNRDFLEKEVGDAERLGSIQRVTAERHGAIRVGSPKEMSQVATVFEAFGMYPVGFYDLRDASASSVPVVSTAFRPVDAEELALNPFRVFTSMLAADDPRFFNAEQQRKLQEFINARILFPQELLSLAEKATEQEGLDGAEASTLLDLATASFELSSKPVDHAWYRELESVSAVAADIGGVPSTHINHLTPRVLDIEDLYARMESLGIAMIDEVQGPPSWQGPDVLLRQTSFRALSEERIFKFEDGSVGPGALRVRFGEVEQRGIALTPRGRELYDRMVVDVDKQLQETGGVRTDVARQVWQDNLPDTEAGLLAEGLAYFEFDLAPGQAPTVPAEVSLKALLDDTTVQASPIVYEDFLPRSAAGIFQSNLTGEGTKDAAQKGTEYDLETLSKIIGRDIADPFHLYQAQVDASIARLAEKLNTTIINDTFLKENSDHV